eukprot:1002617-Amphidinium_carterae.1
MSAGLELPKHICAHGFLTKDAFRPWGSRICVGLRASYGTATKDIESRSVSACWAVTHPPLETQGWPQDGEVARQCRGADGLGPELRWGCSAVLLLRLSIVWG